MAPEPTASVRPARHGAEPCSALGLPERDLGELPDSDKRFPDGAQYRVEVPSVEGPGPFHAVMEAAEQHGIQIHRISQGSGMMLLADAEIEQVVALGREHGVEVCLFVDPRGGWDLGTQATSAAGGGAARRRPARVRDRGRDPGLRTRRALRARGRHRPAVGPGPDAAVRRPAAGPGDQGVDIDADGQPRGRTRTRRSRCHHDQPADRPHPRPDRGDPGRGRHTLDVYVESADDFGGVVRYYEIPALVRLAAPVHLKFTVRNAPSLYPSGTHLADLAVATARERVRRAAIGLSVLRRHYPEATASPGPMRA